MKRTYRKRALFDRGTVGKIVLTLFMLYIAYIILTPPSDITAEVPSPDGSKTARLRTVYYYDNQPSYKIHYRETGKTSWSGLYALPAYTNTPPDQAKAELRWSDNSERLDFLMNGTSIWHRVFAP